MNPSKICTCGHDTKNDWYKLEGKLFSRCNWCGNVWKYDNEKWILVNIPQGGGPWIL